MFGTDLVDLDMISIQLGRQAPCLKFSGLLVELCDASLELHPEPDVLVFVKSNGQAAGWQVRIELTEDLLAEARVPRDALRIDNHVVRLPCLRRQVVFGVDDLRRFAFRTRKRLEFVIPMFPRT